MRHDSGLEQDQAEQSADEGHLPALVIRLAPVKHHQHPEDSEDQRVAQDGAEHAPQRAAGRRAAAHEVDVERHELLVRLVGHDLPCGDDAVARAHDVLAGVHAAPKFVAPALRLERVGHQGRSEEVPGETHVQLVADARASVGVDGASPPEVLSVRQDLVARHGLLARAATHDQLGGLFDL